MSDWNVEDVFDRWAATSSPSSTPPGARSLSRCSASRKGRRPPSPTRRSTRNACRGSSCTAATPSAGRCAATPTASASTTRSSSSSPSAGARTIRPSGKCSPRASSRARRASRWTGSTSSAAGPRTATSRRELLEARAHVDVKALSAKVRRRRWSSTRARTSWFRLRRAAARRPHPGARVRRARLEEPHPARERAGVGAILRHRPRLHGNRGAGRGRRGPRLRRAHGARARHARAADRGLGNADIA